MSHIDHIDKKAPLCGAFLLITSNEFAAGLTLSGAVALARLHLVTR
jgi:hypothetical protein